MDAQVIIIGAGISGMATAARLQARGLSTLVIEAHGQVGGCAGFFRKRGFSFDVGATTFVDFEPHGVGGQFLSEIGMPPLSGECLPGYQAWLPDRTVRLYRNRTNWHTERLATLGNTPHHHRFWAFLDKLAAAFWTASRAGIKLPFRSLGDIWRAAQHLPRQHWPLTRYISWTIADALKAYHLLEDKPLCCLLNMLLQDTVHSDLQDAPLINGALGVTIRGAGLTRPLGGARGFWEQLVQHYTHLGGRLKIGTRVTQVSRHRGDFTIHTRRGNFRAGQVVSTLPIWNTAELGLPEVKYALTPYLQRNKAHLGGAIVLFLGVPEADVSDHHFTHHQILYDYDKPLNNGNNMFISVSAPGDTASAPPGYRSVMVSTHCELGAWENLSPTAYTAQKKAIGEALLNHAQRVYPDLGGQTEVFEVGTPRTYQKYTHRYRGAVGGIRLTLKNSNQFAVPYHLGLPGFWQAGDTTWPGLGTVACVLGSRHVAEGVYTYQQDLVKKQVDGRQGYKVARSQSRKITEV